MIELFKMFTKEIIKSEKAETKSEVFFSYKTNKKRWNDKETWFGLVGTCTVGNVIYKRNTERKTVT